MDKKTWIAFLVCIVIYLVWFKYVMPYFVPPQKPEEQKTEAPAPSNAAAPSAPANATTPAAKPTPPEQAAAPAGKEAEKKPAAPAGAKPATPAPAVATAITTAPPEKPVVLDAKELPILTEWTNEGGALTKLGLRDYYIDVSHKENVVLLEPLHDDWRTLTLIDPPREGNPVPLEQRMASPLAKTRYEIVKAETTDRKITFRAAFTGGLEVTKTFEVDPEPKYNIRVRVTLSNTNKSGAPIPFQYSLVAPAGIVPDKTSYMKYLTSQIAVDLRPGDASLPVPEHPIQIVVKTADQLQKEQDKFFQVQRDVAWAAVASNYFITIIRPEPEKTPWLYAATTRPLVSQLPPSPGEPPDAPPTLNIMTELTTVLFNIAPGQSVSQDYIFYAGPKRTSTLQQYGNMVQVLDYDYGMFGIITKLFLSMLAAFHKVIPNYGLGIIFLTLLVKIVLHPLTRKTQVSMYKMQKLQPKINALREKYKHNQKTLGQEQWKLFREHRVNPLGGCLPMFLQIPVLIALYNGIAYSIEFRQQPFFGWIKDLAQPDTLAILPFSLPLLGNQLNILPIIMVVSWVIQQVTMPKPADPKQAQQQKMMMFMPLVFGFMFYAMPSGLVLYWLTNTLLGTLEQYYIKKHLAKIVIE